MIELKPCPFCGGKAEYICYDDEEYHIVRCKDCGAEIGWIDSKEEVFRKWNNRPESKPLSLEELKQMDGEPVYCVDIYGEGKWALVDTADETCVDSNFDNWGILLLWLVGIRRRMACL